MLTHAEYTHNNPIPVCGTIIPKPQKEVKINAKALAKATRTIREIGEVNHPYAIAAHARALALFSKLKGKGQLTALEISQELKISRRGAALSAERLIASGQLLIIKRENQCALYEWKDGATGYRKEEEKPLKKIEERFAWMKGEGWLMFADIAERTGLGITKVRDKMSELSKLGLVTKLAAEKKNGGILMKCRWVE